MRGKTTVPIATLPRHRAVGYLSMMNGFILCVELRPALRARVRLDSNHMGLWRLGEVPRLQFFPVLFCRSLEALDLDLVRSQLF